MKQEGIMERSIFIEDEILSLVQYTRDDDVDWHNCWLDIETQKAYNIKSNNEPFDPAKAQDISQFPFWATVFDKQNERFIGVVRLSPPPYDDCDLAIWMYKPYRKKGYGTRAFYLGVKYCFDNLNLEKVGAGCYENNETSQKMLRKIGFIRDGKNDSHETDAFTGEPIVQQEFTITKNNFQPIYY